MSTFRIAVIPGDGIGPDVTNATRTVLDALGSLYGHRFVFEEWLAGGIAIDATGEPLPQATVLGCRKSHAVLLGALGGPAWDDLPGHLRPEKGLLALRSSLGLFANLRPARLHPPLASASPLHPTIAQKGIDLVFVRELTGGIYFGESGRQDSPQGTVAYDTLRYSTLEIERIARRAFELAQTRRKRVTSVDKANVLESSRLWRSVVTAVAADYPDVSLDHLYVDNASMQLISRPDTFDVLVAGNLFADILSDEAGMITGSIGMLPSASIGVPGQPGLFEPVHGSAPDLAGQNRANPLATILSGALMLRLSLGLDDEALAIEQAVDRVLAAGYRTEDILDRSAGASPQQAVGTAEMTRQVIHELQAGKEAGHAK